MEIKSDCKKIVTKICLNIELENENDIRLFSNILANAERRIIDSRSQYRGEGYDYSQEIKMLREIEKELK